MLDNSHPLPPNKGDEEVAKVDGHRFHRLNVPTVSAAVNVEEMGYTFQYGNAGTTQLDR